MNTPQIRRGTLVSFDAVAYTAVVMPDGALSSVVMKVGKWNTAALGMVADAEVALIIFDDADPNDGLVVGPY